MNSILEWENHENHVAAIYRLLGYRVKSNINITGQQTDLLCEKEIPGAGNIVLYVDCKYTANPKVNTISKDSINQFIVNFHAMKSVHGWTAGVLVSNRGYTQYAKSAVAPHHDIILKTVDELYADLFQIQTYLHSCIHAYEADETFTDYIPLNATAQDTESSGRAQKLEKLFENWLAKPNNNQLVLLGDFGAGKTTFLRQMHYKYAKAFLAGTSVRMPLYIQLRDYSDVSHGNELIEKFCSLELATRVPQRLFNEFTRAGRFLLLLDAFDEMGVVSDHESRRRNYLKLNQLTRSAAKVVITCRPAYFVTHEELLDVFGYYKGQMGVSAPPTRGANNKTRAYSKLSTELKAASQTEDLKELLAAVGSIESTSTVAALELFDEDQIKAYVKVQGERILSESEGRLDDKTLFAQIGQIYDLVDLASRPILLKLIVNTLPLFKQDSTGKYTVKSTTQIFDDITPSVLYYVYTEGELTREYEKGELRWKIRREERLQLIGRLAFEMFERDSLALDSTIFSALVARHFLIAGEELEQFATDIRTCSFLTLDRNGSLRFAHKSFLEYYVSQHLISLFVSTRKTGEVLGSRTLSEEIYYFLGDLIRSFYPSQLEVMRQIGRQGDSVQRSNAINLLNYAGQPIAQLVDLKGGKLSYVKLRIPVLALRHSHVEVVRWVRCEIDQLRLEKFKIEKLLLQDTTIQALVCTSSDIKVLDCASTRVSLSVSKSRIAALQLTSTSLEKSTISGSTLVMGRCHESSFNNVNFINTLLMASEAIRIPASQIHKVLFDQCVFLYMDFDNKFLTTAKFKNCIFIRCYLKDGLALEHLTGSRGFFEYQGSNSIPAASVETAGRPFLWNRTRAERGPNMLQSIDILDDKVPRLEIGKLVEPLLWEDVLAVAFPDSKLKRVSNWTIGAVRKTLSKIEKQFAP